MRSLEIYTLGIAAAVHLTVALPTAVGQASTPDACAFIDAAELKRLTARKDIPGGGPKASAPGALPKTMSQCDYLGFTFALTTAKTPDRFAQTRQQHAAPNKRWKVESVSGVGDEAYYLWDYRPGSYRSVGIVFRVGSNEMAVGDMTPSDSIEAMKPLLLTVAKAVARRVR